MDWTWVLQRECPECGYDGRTVTKEEVPGLIRDNADSWQEVFTERADLRERPRPEVWSPLEYACHVRDVFRVYDGRLKRMLAEDDPIFPDWDQDAAAVQERYGEQDPQQVIIDLRLAAQVLASAFARVEGSQWQRSGTRDDGVHFTVETLARYLAHDPIHHLYDVTRAY
jgi:hypothetical protein